MSILSQLLKRKSRAIVSIADGKIMHLENIPDYAFSHCLIGDGLAVEINSNQIYAPCHGIVHMIASTKHAFIITLDNDTQVLIHIGLDQKKNNFENFHYHIQVGDYVTPETLILTLSEEFLKKHHYQVIIPIIILNYQEHSIQTMTTSSYVKRGEKILTCK